MTRIIVADDDRVTSHLLCAVLRKEGFAPEAALDVPSLFLLLESPPLPQVVLLDLHMPGGTGLDSVRRFFADPAMAAVPLVLMSGTAGTTEEAEALRLGAVAFLLKPVQAAQLLDAVRRAAQGPRRRGEQE